ncbi:MAG: type III PLP-dependent enzyme [Candidatus Atribacteria bacterium]|nr:type III PLP-dependent enzyme [Candidatus Atribacteria bacterium]MCD6349401.1 type III PLP-dependent enzyme [Candidatus Atribacteria bacterium]
MRSLVISKKLPLEKERIIDLVKTYDTPLFVILKERLIENFLAFARFLPGVEPFYAVKANPHPEIIRTLNSLGSCFDVASKQEVQLVHELGIEPKRMIFANTIKRKKSLALAREIGLKLMTYDNLSELCKIAKVHPEAELLLRITSPSNRSGANLSYKFGVDPDEALFLLLKTRKMGLRPVGISFHAGSPCYRVESYLVSLRAVRKIFSEARREGIELSIVDIGGGFPLKIYQEEEEEKSLESLSSKIYPHIESFLQEGYRVIAEPGRCIVGSACFLVTKVIGKALRKGKIWYYLDEGIYGTLSAIPFDKASPEFVTLKEGGELKKAILAGPTCDSLDVIARDILLPELELDDLIVVPDIGAYSIASATNFNGFEKPMVVMV